MQRLFDETDDESSGKPKPPAAPAAPAPKAGEPAAPAAPAEPQIRSRKPAPPKRPDLPLVTPAAPAVPAAPAAPADDKEFEAGLVEGEQQMLADARYAEKMDSTKYRGLGDKVKNFIKAHTKYLEDHPDIEENDPAYQKFLLDHRPGLTPTQVREIEEHRIGERVSGPTNQRIGNLEHELFVRDENPKIENFANETYRQLAREGLPAEIAAEIKKADGKLTPEIQQKYTDELEIAHTIFTLAANDLKVFRQLTTRNPATKRSLVEFDEKNPQHTRITQMIAELCVAFRDTGGAELQRNGKWFVTRDEWNQLDPARRDGFWTFTNPELEKRALAMVPDSVKKTIQLKQDDLSRRGYIRKTAVVPVPPVPPAPAAPEPPGAPAIRPSPVPSAPGGGSPGTVDASTKNLASTLLRSE